MLRLREGHIDVCSENRECCLVRGIYRYPGQALLSVLERLATRAAQLLSKTLTTGLRVQQLNMLILDNFIFQKIEKNGWWERQEGGRWWRSGIFTNFLTFHL